MMEVGGQEESRGGFELFEFIFVPPSHADGGSIAPVDKTQKVQGDMIVPAKAEKGDGEAAAMRVREKNGSFPSYYI